MIESKENLKDCPNRKSPFTEKELKTLKRRLVTMAANSREFGKKLNSVSASCVRLKISIDIARCRAYAEYCLNKSFVTRWYWNWRLNKCLDSLEKSIGDFGMLFDERQERGYDDGLQWTKVAEPERFTEMMLIKDYHNYRVGVAVKPGDYYIPISELSRLEGIDEDERD